MGCGFKTLIIASGCSQSVLIAEYLMSPLTWRPLIMMSAPLLTRIARPCRAAWHMPPTCPSSLVILLQQVLQLSTRTSNMLPASLQA